MPKKRYVKRKPRAKKRYARRRALIPRQMNDKHLYKQTYTATTVNSSTGGSFTYSSYTFTLGAIPQVANFTGLYDMYKINLVKIQFIPRGTSGEIDTSHQVTGGTHMCVIDRDGNFPTTENAFREYGKLKERSMLKPMKLVFKPSILNEIYRGVATTGYEVKRPGYLDCSYSDIPHYGVAYGIQNTSTVTQIIDVRITLYFGCRNVR